MQSLRNAARMGFVVMALAVALIAPGAVSADDGEIGDMADTDSITDVKVVNGHASATLDYVHNCAGVVGGPILSCAIQAQFVSRCPEVWCGWVSQPWRQISSTGVATAACMGSGNEDNEWYINYRAVYVATKTISNSWKGEFEYGVGIGGSVGHKIIAEAHFDNTDHVGFSGGTTTETVTAATDYSPITLQAATSGGRDLVTC